jgi:hypothetical protein
MILLFAGPTVTDSFAGVCVKDIKITPENQVTAPEHSVVQLNARPAQGRDVVYSWRQLSGPEVYFNPADGQLEFTAPEVPFGGAVLQFSVTVTCAADANDSKTAFAQVQVTNLSVNAPPLARIVVSPSDVFEGNTVTLDGNGSTDPDGDVLTYAWTQIGDPTVSLTDAHAATPTFVAPQVGVGGLALSFRLTVSDGFLTNSTDVIVNVLNVNQAPTVSIACPTGHADEGSAVTLFADASDDDTIASYSWTHTDGGPPVTATGDDWESASLQFTAPYLTAPGQETQTFRVEVTDNEGLHAADTCSVQIHDITTPVLTLPADMTEEATSAAGAAIGFEATAEDAYDGTVDVTCTPVSGTTFPLGATTVQCSAKDAADNESTGSFTITVRDTTPPALRVPSDLTNEATGPSGAVVTFEASAEDLVDGIVDVTCDHHSGDTFPLGNTTVTCTADDAAGNHASGSFLVTVEDTTPPQVTVPADITEEATGPSGAVASFTATASDLVTQNVTVTCTPSSGSTFPLGTTEVSCSATDEANNTGSATFHVKVQDTTPPALTLPSNMTREATGPSGAVAAFTATALDLVSGTREVACTPATGATFALGTTTVSCSASDAAGNTATGSFTVRVVDTTPPVIAAHVDESFVLGSSTVYTPPTASDLVDGAVPVICIPAPNATFALGPTTVTCTATDKQGNRASSSFTVRVLFAQASLCLAGPGRQVLQPIAPAGTSVFRKTGSTVPVKFRVCDAAGNSYHETNPVTSFQFVGVVSGTAPVEPNTDVVSTSADTQFRWSDSDQFWIFNLATKSYSAGLTYIFRISLADGSHIDFQFGLK